MHLLIVVLILAIIVVIGLQLSGVLTSNKSITLRNIVAIILIIIGWLITFQYFGYIHLF